MINTCYRIGNQQDHGSVCSRQNRWRAPALVEVLSTLASAALGNERERVLERIYTVMVVSKNRT